MRGRKGGVFIVRKWGKNVTGVLVSWQVGYESLKHWWCVAIPLLHHVADECPIDCCEHGLPDVIWFDPDQSICIRNIALQMIFCLHNWMVDCVLVRLVRLEPSTTPLLHRLPQLLSLLRSGVRCYRSPPQWPHSEGRFVEVEGRTAEGIRDPEVNHNFSPSPLLSRSQQTQHWGQTPMYPVDTLRTNWKQLSNLFTKYPGASFELILNLPTTLITLCVEVDVSASYVIRSCDCGNFYSSI